MWYLWRRGSASVHCLYRWPVSLMKTKTQHGSQASNLLGWFSGYSLQSPCIGLTFNADAFRFRRQTDFREVF